MLGELLAKEPLFPARGEVEALGMVVDLLGVPTADAWPVRFFIFL